VWRQSMHHADEVLGGMFDPLEAVRSSIESPLRMFFPICGGGY
jgi:hypothetical protein